MAAAICRAGVLRGGWTDHAAVLADPDGCRIAGGSVLPQMPALSDACGERLWVMSNRSTDTAAGLSRRLAGVGLDLAAGRIPLAGE